MDKIENNCLLGDECGNAKVLAVMASSDGELATQAQWGGPAYEYGVTWGPQTDRDRAFVELAEAVGLYIYNNNGAKILPLKRAWNAAFPHAKEASLTQSSVQPD